MLFLIITCCNKRLVTMSVYVCICVKFIKDALSLVFLVLFGSRFYVSLLHFCIQTQILLLSLLSFFPALLFPLYYLLFSVVIHLCQQSGCCLQHSQSLLFFLFSFYKVALIHSVPCSPPATSQPSHYVFCFQTASRCKGVLIHFQTRLLTSQDVK